MRYSKFGLCLLLAASASAQGPRELKPGWNLFSPEQDIQLGREAAAEIEKQYAVVQDKNLAAYISRIGSKLASTSEAGGFPYTFKLVADPSINAFALPGGPSFVHTGLIVAADNEAQLAGVLAHEIAHVALRHGTNQASKANLIQLPIMLASGMLGKNSSMLGQLAQLGIGLGANSVLLKFSRSAETDADLLGARIMAKAGYNPIEMARFFAKLEEQGGARGPQFLSDHPNPGNRVKAVETEIGYMRQAAYTTGDAREFARMKQRTASVPLPKTQPQPAATTTASGTARLPQVSVSKSLREYRGRSYVLSYPDNWQVNTADDGASVTIAPPEGLVQTANGGVAIGIGVVVEFAARTGDLRRDTDSLIQQITSSNAGMQVQQRPKAARVNGQTALITKLQSPSPFASETEIDTLVTVERPEGLFYIVMITPQKLAQTMQVSFDAVLRSIRFSASQPR